jgi:transposase
MDKTVSSSYSPVAQATIAGLVTSNPKSGGRSGRRTKVDRREAIALYLSGVHVADIAKHYKADRSTIYAHLNSAGVTPKRKRHSKPEQAEPQAGPKRKQRAGYKVKNHVISKIVALYEQGHKVEAIAEYVGVSPSSAYKYIALHKKRQAKRKVAPPEIQASIVVTQPSLWSRIKSWFS